MGGIAGLQAFYVSGDEILQERKRALPADFNNGAIIWVKTVMLFVLLLACRTRFDVSL